jgi:hypothetical protein
MAGKSHPLGFCTCKHAADHWDRPRHCTNEEVTYLEQYFGRLPDERIAKHLGRTVVGVRLKAKPLRIRKRHAGLTARSTADIFGVDAKTVTGWIAKGLLRARRGYVVGQHRTWLISEDDVEDFIRDHGQYVDLLKMPESCYRELAEQDARVTLADVELRVGESPHRLVAALKAGAYRGALRGPHWYVAGDELPRIAAVTDTWRRSHLAVLRREREERLLRRRNKRMAGPHHVLLA